MQLLACVVQWREIPSANATEVNSLEFVVLLITEENSDLSVRAFAGHQQSLAPPPNGKMVTPSLTVRKHVCKGIVVPLPAWWRGSGCSGKLRTENAPGLVFRLLSLTILVSLSLQTAGARSPLWLFLGKWNQRGTSPYLYYILLKQLLSFWVSSRSAESLVCTLRVFPTAASIQCISLWMWKNSKERINLLLTSKSFCFLTMDKWKQLL